MKAGCIGTPQTSPGNRKPAAASRRRGPWWLWLCGEGVKGGGGGMRKGGMRKDAKQYVGTKGKDELARKRDS